MVRRERCRVDATYLTMAFDDAERREVGRVPGGDMAPRLFPNRQVSHQVTGADELTVIADGNGLHRFDRSGRK